MDAPSNRLITRAVRDKDMKKGCRTAKGCRQPGMKKGMVREDQKRYMADTIGTNWLSLMIWPLASAPMTQ